MSIARISALAVVLTAAALVAAPATFAKDGDVRVRGVCTQSSTAKLKLGDENGRIEVEFEVDQNRVGVAWKLALQRNGAVVARTSALTRAPSGSFTVRRLVGNGPGADRVVVVATSPTGEHCTARASL